ncbi:MAG: bifunctional sugar-1-phosphate nucleotidylyltransferase/acetyltransferase [Promethearchaeota archaeon]
MKAVVLAAGEGKRLRPITSSRPKPMIKVAGKPILEHIMDGLISTGISEILLIVKYKEHVIREYFGDGNKSLGLSINYITQEECRGTAHATNYAKDFVKNDDFLMMYGDLLVDPQVFKNLVKVFDEKKPDGIISLIKVENSENYGIISLDHDGNVEKIIEKPPPGLNAGNLANAGIYILKPIIFQAIEKTKLSSRNEYEFTDSLQILINEFKCKILGYIIDDLFWSDIGLPWQLLDANEYFLSKQEPKMEGIIEENVHISGNVYIGKETRIKSGTVIQGPCYIGKNSLIGPNAYIRPSTSIGDDCHVGMSEVKNSMIFSETAVPHFNYVGDSIICENVNLGAGTKISNLRFDNKSVKMNIKGQIVDSKRRKLGAIIGPNSQTGINVSIMCGKKIGENSIIGAHSIVNEDVPSNTLYYQDPNGKVIKKKNPFLKNS